MQRQPGILSMSLKNKLAAPAKSLLKRLGPEIIGTSEMLHLRKMAKMFDETSFSNAILPEGAEAYLSLQNPGLTELKARYGELNLPASQHSEWTADYVSK